MFPHIVKFSTYKYIIALILLILFLLPGTNSIYGRMDGDGLPATVTILRSAPTTLSNFATGATHTQAETSFTSASPAWSTLAQTLQSSLTYQNVHIMGWGADDPEPQPGVYNWSSLDARVQLMRSTQAQKVITLCCAPGWMRPAGNQNDWDKLEIAPEAAHLQDFAALAKTVALRYPDVQYFQVWNELKGMWSTDPGATSGLDNANRWDYARYTTLYNAVYDAIKSVRPDAKIGGPYVNVASSGSQLNMSNPGPAYNWGTLDQRALDVISYWLKNKHGADFITVDGSSINGDNVQPADVFTAGQKFADVYSWIRNQPDGGATLPIWWAEWYASLATHNPSSLSQSLDYYNAVMASAEIHTLMSGIAVALIWSPQGDTHGYSYPEGLWSSDTHTANVQVTPYAATSNAFKMYFPPGTPIYQTQVSTSDVTVLASPSKTMLVNHLHTSQVLVVDKQSFFLAPYQVLLINTP